MRILLVDDEPLARERLQRLLQRLRPDAECREADSGQAALALLDEFDPELLLLDVQMPGMDGLELAAMLTQVAQPPAVIFCTAYEEYALAALRHQAVAYLLKPVREAELDTALTSASRINRVQVAALRRGGRQRQQLSSQTHRGLATIAVADVRCFLAQQKYVTASSATRELLLPDTLKELQTEFASEFVRVHRNAMVALRHVVGLRRGEGGSWEVELDGVELRPSVSRRHLAELKARLQRRRRR